MTKTVIKFLFRTIGCLVSLFFLWGGWFQYSVITAEYGLSADLFSGLLFSQPSVVCGMLVFYAECWTLNEVPQSFWIIHIPRRALNLPRYSMGRWAWFSWGWCIPGLFFVICQGSYRVSVKPSCAGVIVNMLDLRITWGKQWAPV